MSNAPLHQLPDRKTVGMIVATHGAITEENSVEVGTGACGERHVVMLDRRFDEGGVWVESKPAETYQVKWHEPHEWNEKGRFELCRLDDSDREDVLARAGLQDR